METLPMIEWTENELRAEAEKRINQYSKAQARVDKGFDNCIGQANKYMHKYQSILHIMYLKNFALSEEELNVMKFAYGV